MSGALDGFISGEPAWLAHPPSKFIEQSITGRKEGIVVAWFKTQLHAMILVPRRAVVQRAPRLP